MSMGLAEAAMGFTQEQIEARCRRLGFHPDDMRVYPFMIKPEIEHTPTGKTWVLSDFMSV